MNAIVHFDICGPNEVALHGFTRAVSMVGNELEELEITPEEAGLSRWPGDLDSVRALPLDAGQARHGY